MSGWPMIIQQTNNVVNAWLHNSNNSLMNERWSLLIYVWDTKDVWDMFWGHDDLAIGQPLELFSSRKKNIKSSKTLDLSLGNHIW